MKDEEFYTMIEQLIDTAFDTQLGKKKEKPMEMQETAPQEELEPMGSPERAQAGEVFESIEDYTARTGKRFRMLKDQKSRGLTREEAFTETFGGSV